MGKILWTRYVVISVLVLLMGTTQLSAMGPCSVTFDPNIDTYTSADSPIVIDAGLTQLNDGTYTITADTSDITVVLCGDAILQGDDATRINFVAHNGFKITVVLDHNLTYQGKDQTHPLLVTSGGLGDVVYSITGGKGLSIGSVDGNHPAKMFVLMDDPCYATGEKPTLLFRRACSTGVPLVDTQDVTITINPHSLLSYLSQQNDIYIAEDQAIILFDPGNVMPSDMVPYPGTMVLKLQGGGFVIAGHWVDVPNPIPGSEGLMDSCIMCTTCLYNQEFAWTDIKLPIAAGHKATTFVKVSSSACDYSRQGGLRVANYNTQLFELLSDPFCTLGTRTDMSGYVGSFNGIREGFVLGANALLEIADNTFVDYKAFSPNLCPDTLPSVADYDGFIVPAKRLLKKRNPSAFFVDGNNNPDASAAEIRMGKHAGLFFRSLFKSHFDIGSMDFVVDPADRAFGEGEYVFIVEAPLCVHGENKCENKERSKIEILSLQVRPFGGELFPCDHKKQFPMRTFNRHESCRGDYEAMGAYLAYNKAAFLINDGICLFDTSLVHTDMSHRVLEKNDQLSEPTYVGGEKWVLGCGKIVTCRKDRHNNDDFEFDNIPTSDIPASDISASEPVEDPACPPACLETIAVERPFISLFNSRIDLHTDVAFTGVDIRVPNIIDDCRECVDNCSKIIFYQNGNRVDDGFGRNLILGTHIGSTACDMCTIINSDAHLDVIQIEEGDYCTKVHVLTLGTASNCPSIVECAHKHHSTMRHPGVNNIYLGHDSNISIGLHEHDSHHSRFAHGSPATLFIDGNFFAFSSHGGRLCDPRLAHITGQGGIFVDKHGTFKIARDCRAVMDVMVTRNGNGHVDLPADQVVFGPLFGITDWRLDLSHEDRGRDHRDSIVHREEHISHYTFNWIGIHHDRGGFLGYSRKYRPFIIPCADKHDFPRVKEDNVHGLAKVEGIVDEFQVQGSRIGNEAVFEVNGGRIRELVFVPANHGGEIAAAVVVLKNDGIVGVGPAFPEAESLFASTTLGINGVTIIADGSGRVELNHDLIINNRCAFFKGPHFASGFDTLEITSDKVRTIRVRPSGCLDFRSFDNSDDIVRFGGNIRLIMEPGSSILMGGGVLQCANDVTVIIEPSVISRDIFRSLRIGDFNEHGNPHESQRAAGAHHPYAPLTKCGHNVKNTDEFRVKIHGAGLIQLKDDARLFIDKHAFVGIETLHDGAHRDHRDHMHERDGGHHRGHGGCRDHKDHDDHDGHRGDRGDGCDRCCGKDKHHKNKKSCISVTDITIELNDNALFSLGGDMVSQGGVLQVGNTQDHENHEVRFRLLVNGLNARFMMAAQSFLGLNAGIVRQGEYEAPNDWLIDVLWNVSTISIDVQKGLFSHAQIYSGDDQRASLLAIGQHKAFPDSETRFNLFYPAGAARSAQANIHGGGNMVLITGGLGAFHPIVLDQDGTIDVSNDQRPQGIHTHMKVGVLASRVLLSNEPVGNVRALAFFQAIKLLEAVSDVNSRDSGLAVAAIDEVESSGLETRLRVVAIDRGTINRTQVTTIFAANGGTEESNLKQAADIGAVDITFTADEPAPSSVTAVNQIS